jgi:hypothetical protein
MSPPTSTPETDFAVLNSPTRFGDGMSCVAGEGPCLGLACLGQDNPHPHAFAARMSIAHAEHFATAGVSRFPIPERTVRVTR